MHSDEELDSPVEAPEEQNELEEGASEPEVEAEPSAGPRLILRRSGADTEFVFPLSSPAVVGRFDPAVGPVDVDLGPLDEGVYVSRKHAQFELEDGVWKLRDLGSSNGTFVLRDDFERIEEAELEDGTEIAFGNARFVFRL
ncbi:MAG: FHA domain-containing protein [Fimbriimonadaceae bacterium]|nr:FHA domain-containing protein [Chthonomonadaceae bacterium]MCO5296693.1 FHA domain-containing protein [Fimbriimonadaceae bacterium]